MLHKKLFFLFLLSSLLIISSKSICSTNSSPSLTLTQKAINNPVQFQVSNTFYNILIDLVIESGWHIYANQKGKVGYPFKLEITKSTNLSNYQFHFPKPIKLQLNTRQDITYIYKDSAQLKIDLEPIDHNQPIEVQLNLEYGACNNICAIFNEQIHYIVYPFVNHNSQPNNSSKEFIIMIIFAMIGGFILNFMPCVLPVISIKILSIVKSKKFDHHVTKQELFFTVIGIISTFCTLAIIVIILKHLGQYVNWGMHFQEPIFLMILIIILITFANNLWSEFGSNLKLPDYFLNKLLHLSEKNLTYISSFFAGVLATLLATPCLAPFISTSVAFAITQTPLTILLVYSSIGLGMALPYILMILAPQLLKIFPKPGKWMIAFKKIMALSLLGTAFWLLYSLFHQLNTKIFLLFTIIIISKTILFHLTHKKKVLLFIIISLATATIILSFYTNKFEHQKDLELDSLWILYDDVVLDKLLKENHIILLDVTASWCINCHYNKYFILENKDILEFLKQEKVILMQADYTKKSEKIEQLLKKYHRPGIPLDIVYCSNHHKGLTLPEILSAKDVVDAIKSCTLP